MAESGIVLQCIVHCLKSQNIETFIIPIIAGGSQVILEVFTRNMGPFQYRSDANIICFAPCFKSCLPKILHSYENSIKNI